DSDRRADAEGAVTGLQQSQNHILRKAPVTLPELDMVPVRKRRGVGADGSMQAQKCAQKKANKHMAADAEHCSHAAGFRRKHQDWLTWTARYQSDIKKFKAKLASARLVLK